MAATDSGTWRKTRGKTEHHLLPAARSLLCCFLWEDGNSDTSYPFTTSVLLRSPQHLPSVPSGSWGFSTNTPVCLPGAGSAGEEWESRERLFQGAELPQLQGTGERHRTHLIVPWTIEGSRSLPSSFHPCFQHHTIFFPCGRSCEQNHTLTQPAWTGLKAKSSETIFIFTPPQRVQTYQFLMLTFAMGIVTY